MESMSHSTTTVLPENMQKQRRRFVRLTRIILHDPAVRFPRWADPVTNVPDLLPAIDPQGIVNSDNPGFQDGDINTTSIIIYLTAEPQSDNFTVRGGRRKNVPGGLPPGWQSCIGAPRNNGGKRPPANHPFRN